MDLGLKPGTGNASLTTDIKGKRIATQRDLLREEMLLDQLDQTLPCFFRYARQRFTTRRFTNSFRRTRTAGVCYYKRKLQLSTYVGRKVKG